MSADAKKIRDKVTELGKNYDLIYPVTVTKIDKNACTIDAKDIEGMEIFDIKLRALATADKGIIVYPKNNTIVQIASVGDDGDHIVISVDEPEEIVWIIEGMNLKMNKDGFVFNDGNNKGMVLMPKAIERLNKIEEDINSLKTVFSSWAVTPQDGGAALKTAAASWFAQQLVKTVQSDIENTKIKQ